jgi:drug/metabolite transporter (DMT)-like permease
VTVSPNDSAPALPSLRPLRGLALLMAALLAFACMDVSIKYLAAHYSVPLIVAIRYLVHLALMLVLVAPILGKRLVQTRRTGLVLIRAVCLALMSLLVGLALQRMPVAEVTAVTFLAPMLVVLLARPLLGERIGGLGWIAAIAGFGGVLIIVRPGAGLPMAGVVFALAAVSANVIYQLLSRSLARTERAVAMLFYTALAGTVAFGFLLPWTVGGERPTLLVVALFVCTGALGGLGHYLFTLAYREAPASVLAPLNYVQLLWAGLLGWLVFHHVPDAVTIAGMAVVAASGALIALKARYEGRRVLR